MKGASLSPILPTQYPVKVTSRVRRILANLMLPDGAERQQADWTVFFLNQTPFNTIKPVLALDNDDAADEQEDGSRMLYVINLVRTRLDKTARRCVSLPSLLTLSPLHLRATPTSER